MWSDFLQAPSLRGLHVAFASSSYPPFPYLIVSPFYLLFSRSADVAVLGSGALWLGLLLSATYGIGREVYNRKSGLLAALIISLYPIIIALERDFWLDLQLTAAVALALWALLWVKDFDNRKRAIVLGLTLGFGTWIKWPFSFFVFASFLAVIFQVWQHGGWSRKRFTSLGLCLGIAGIMAGCQYLTNFLFLPSEFYNLNSISRLVTSLAQAANHPAWYTRQGIVYNFTALVNHQATLFFTLLFLFSLPAFYKRDVRGRLVLSIAILVPYILATLLPVKEQRITVPYLPTIAVFTAVGLAKIRWKILQTVVILLVLGVGLFQWWVISWGVPSLPDHIYWGNSWIYFAIFDQHHVRSPRDFTLQQGDWKAEELLDAILQDASINDISLPTDVPLIANTPAYNANTLNYFSVLHEADVEFISVWNWMGEPISLETHPYSYLVLRSGQYLEMIEGWDKEEVQRAEQFLADHRESFILIYKAPLPDGAEIQLFRRIDNSGGAP